LIIQQGSPSRGSWPSPFSPDNRKILVNNCFDDCYTLLVFDLDQNTLIQLSDRSERGAWSPDGQRIAFGDIYDRRLNIINVDGTEQTELLEKIEALDGLDFRVGTITWSPDGQRIAFTARGLSNGEAERIYETRLDGAELQQREEHFPPPLHYETTNVRSITWGQVKEETLNDGLRKN
jgi:Tol biopolymer transport system component